MEDTTKMDMAYIMTFPSDKSKSTCVSFEIKQRDRDHMVRCAADILMYLSDDIDENFMLSLDSDLIDL